MLLVLLAVSGCQTISFYSQAIQGHYEIVARQEPIERIVASHATPEQLRSKLELVQLARGFAEKRLFLPVDGHYRKYADLERQFVVWNVEAAPRFSLEPKGWWYPLVGRLEYRGYFRERAARQYAERLRDKGYDVHISGASAYSTLGWFKDPILNTFAFESDTDLVETLFHELAHQRVFVPGDKDFNEAFATLVGREGVRRWLDTLGQQEKFERYQQQTRREDDFAELILQSRRRLERLYGDERDKEGRLRAARRKHDLPEAQLAAAKEQVFEDLRRQYKGLKERWGGTSEYDGWFLRPINNAKLNSVAAYHELVPGFQRLLDAHQGDLPRFYQAVERLSRIDKEKRREALQSS